MLIIPYLYIETRKLPLNGLYIHNRQSRFTTFDGPVQVLQMAPLWLPRLACSRIASLLPEPDSIQFLVPYVTISLK